MRIRFSKQLMDDLHESVRAAVDRTGMVNIPELAEQIRLRNIGDNVALEDIAAQVMVQAQMASAVMEFDTPREAGREPARESAPRGGMAV